MPTSDLTASRAARFVRVGSFYYLLFFLYSGSYGPFIYVYLSELGLTGQQVGWLSSLFPFMTLLLATPIASFADGRRLRVRVLQVAMAATSVTLLLLPQSTGFWWIAGLMLVMAIVSSPIMSVADSLIARNARRHAREYGGMRMWGSLGFAASAQAFGAIWQAVGFGPMFFVAALILWPLIWLTGRIEEIPAQTPGAGPTARRSPFSLLRDGGLVVVLLATFLSGISNSLAMTFSGIYARSLGGGNLLIGMMIAFGAVAEIATMYFSSRIVKRLGGSSAMLIAYGLMASAFLGFAVSTSAVALPLFSILKGLGYGLWFTVTVRMVTERTPEAWASTAQSLLGVAMFGLAPLVAGPLGGWIHDAISPGAVFWLGIATLALAAITIGVGATQKRLASSDTLGEAGVD